MAAWPIKRMDELCEITSSKRIFAADYVSEGVPFYRGREITEKYKGNLDVSTELFITEEKFREIERKFGAPKQGELLLTSVGTLGSVYVVKPGDRFYFKDGNLTWFRHFKGLNSQFLYYWIGSPQGKAELQKCTIGSSQSAFTIVLLKGMEIELPPLPVQQRIAGILSAYDELIENSQRRIKILESMARALYREWFVHFRFPGHETHPSVASPLGEIPQGWEVKKLGGISSYINRGITPQYDEEGDSVVINQKCVRDQRLNLEPARRQSKAIPSEKQVCFGDVLINSTGVGTLGRVAQVYENLENCTVDTHVTIARAARNTDLDFYGCCLLSLQETFERLGVGATGQTELGRAAISEIELVVPPIDLQRQFGVAAKGMRSAAEAYGKQIQNLRRTRDLLLPRLLSGQINIDRS